MFINLIVASSNLYGFTLFEHIENIYIKAYLLFIIFCSSLMHLSETKHNLPGIYPFNKYSQFFLNLDRIVAISAIYYCMYKYISIFKCNDILINAIVGISSLYISENRVKNQLLFAFFHSIWHIQAYYILYKLETYNRNA